MRAAAGSVNAAVTARAIAFDDDAKDFLDNVEMKHVLQKAAKLLGGKIAVVGMDACLMNMVEVAYQIRGTASVMVGSEEVEPTRGWPYDTILKALAAKPTTSPAELGKTIVARYLASYGANSGVTQSALDLARTEGLKKAIDVLATALSKNLSSPAALLAFGRARNSAQTYDTEDYIDIVDFCRLLAKLTKIPAIVKACKAVESQGVAPLVLASGYKGAAMKGSHGVSIYFPKGDISTLYARLDFAKKSRWPAFLKKYRAATTA